MLDPSFVLRGQVRVSQALAWGSHYLKSFNIESSDRTAQELLCRLLHLERAGLLADSERVLTQATLARFQRAVRKRARHVPLQYLTGREWFCDREFKVGPGVLIPRPETELLVQTALERSARTRREVRLLADLGTGSGILALTLAGKFSRAQAWGTDLSGPALRWARRNAHHLHARRVHWRRGEADGPIPRRLRGKFDLVVSNPPYIPTGELERLQPEVRFEPRPALDGGPDGLSGVRVMVEAAGRLLQPGGLAVMEIGLGQGEEVRRIFEAGGFLRFEVLPDWNAIPRIVSGVLERDRP